MPRIEAERRARAEARIGTVLRGKWRVDAVLGGGGMATVFRATHRNGLPVAVKILHPELSFNDEARRRFVNEGYASNRIGHEGVVKVLDDDIDDDGCAFLVMELLDGESLEQRRERCGGTLPAVEVLKAADAILDVLASAHDKGVIHRDLKPENLFLTRDGRLKVLDFGLARLQELSGDARLTAEGAGIMGTPSFLPPEQARGRWEDIDGRTDLWALGATMLTLLTGRFVHDGGTINELLAAAMTRPAPPLRALWPDAPAEVAAIVDRALLADRAARFPNAAAMREAVRGALVGLGGRAPPGSSEIVTVRRNDGAALSPTMVSARSSPDDAAARAASGSASSSPTRGSRFALLLGLAVLAGALAAGAGFLHARQTPSAAAAPEERDAGPAMEAPAPPTAAPSASSAAIAAPVIAAAKPIAPGTASALPRVERPPVRPSATAPTKVEPPSDPFDRRH
ncbi:MAG: serine/threonine-protein kinase [Byssovorax sp.]